MLLYVLLQKVFGTDVKLDLGVMLLDISLIVFFSGEATMSTLEGNAEKGKPQCRRRTCWFP